MQHDGRRRARRGLAAALALATLLVTPAGAAPSKPAPAAPPTGGRIEAGLLEQLSSGATDRFIVEFKAEADLRARAPETWTARGRRVHSELVATADESQGAVAAAVEAAPNATSETFWIANEMLVERGTVALAREIAARAEVALVRAERTVPLVDPVATGAAPDAVATPWGVAAVHAPEAWMRGVTGQGVVVGSVDTGVLYTHSALAAQYRGRNANGTFSHDYNWFDPSATCQAAPCDSNGHGTHTMGTMVGGDGAGPGTKDIGVAPGAKWIAARGCRTSSCSESDLLGAGQFMLAPTTVTGTNPDPARRPHIVNNSWGGPGGDRWYDATVTAWRAAGIVPVFSAGNSGSACNSIGSPADGPNALAVAAYASSGTIASFSSRGGTSYLGKPDVAAPGVDVESAWNDGVYRTISGTSMAAPHAAGVLALMLSASPALSRDVGHAVQVVRHAAVDTISSQCTSPQADPNTVWGDGKVDAVAALDLIATHGTLKVRTVDPQGAPVGATVQARQTAAPQRTFQLASSGEFGLYLAAGAYSVTATATGFSATPTAATVQDGTETVVTLTMKPDPGLGGFVRNFATNAAIASATVRVTPTGGGIDKTATSAADGRYRIVLTPGSYAVTASAPNFGPSTPVTVSVPGGTDVVLDITLKPNPALAGVVRRADTNVPISGATVRTASTPASTSRSATTAADGTYRLVLTTGQHSVTVSAVGFVTSAPVVVTVPEGPDTALNVSLKPLGGVSGFVRADPASPFFRPTVRATTGAGGGSFSTSVIGADGSYRLLLAPGTYSVTATATGYVSAPPVTVTIVDAQMVALDFSLKPEPVLRGVVRRADTGAGIYDALVVATPTTAGGATRIAYSGSTGSYQLSLVPGSYTVTVTATNFASSTPVTVNVPEGADTVRDFSLQAHGAIRGIVRQGTTTVANATVTAVPSGAGPATKATTAADGSYRLGLAPGSYTVSVDAASCTKGSAPATVQVAGSEVTKDFTVIPMPAETKNKYRCVSMPFTYRYAPTSVRPATAAPFARTLPFKFRFYGSNSEKVYISSDGWLSFEKPKNAVNGNTVAIPSRNEPDKAIYVAANGYTAGGLMYVGAGQTVNGVRSYVIEWWSARDSSGGTNSFEVVLWENGTFDVTYLSMAATNRAAAGFERDSKPSGAHLVVNGRATPMPSRVSTRFAPID